MIWAAKDDSASGTVKVPGLESSQPKQEERIAPPAAAPAPTPAPAPAPAPAVVAPAPAVVAPAPTPDPSIEATARSQAAVEVEEEMAPKTGGPGRPKKGWILCINCCPVKGVQARGSGRGVIHLEDVLAEIHAGLLVHWKGTRDAAASSAFDIPVFERRDMISRSAPALAEGFRTDFVVVQGLGSAQSDMRTLVEALMPLAGMKIVDTD